MVKIIAELSINHLGMRKIAEVMIKEASRIGADYVKLKKKNVDLYYSPGKTFRGYEFKKYRGSFELSEDDFEWIDELCYREGIEWFSTVHDLDGFEFFSNYDVPFYKIASSDALDPKFVEWFTEKNTEKVPMIVSTGGMDLEQIKDVVRTIKPHDIPLIINHCVSIYPTPVEQTNIGFIKELQKIDGITVGYSGHEEGWIPTLLAVQLGVEYVERHLALSRDIDIHHIDASLTVDEFHEMVKDIRSLETIMSSKHKGFELEELSFLKDKVYK